MKAPNNKSKKSMPTTTRLRQQAKRKSTPCLQMQTKPKPEGVTGGVAVSNDEMADRTRKSNVSTAAHHTRGKKNPALHSATVAEIAVATVILPKYVCRKENLVTHQYTTYRKIALATRETRYRLSNYTPPKPSQPYTTTNREHMYAPRHFVRMQIKGGKSTEFQIDTGATCNVLRKSELKGTKYERRIRRSPHLLKMYINSTLGKCKIQVRDPTTTKKFKVLLQSSRITMSKVTF